MGVWQSIMNGLDRVGDACSGRDVHFEELMRSFVNGNKEHLNHLEKCLVVSKYEIPFLSKQLVLFCFSKLVLRFHSAYEWHGTNSYGDHVLNGMERRVAVVSGAMQYEFNKCAGKDLFYEAPRFYFAIRNALDLDTIKELQYHEQKCLGFTLFDEYCSVAKAVIGNLNHSQMQDYYFKYMDRITDRAYQIYYDERERLAKEDYEREKRNNPTLFRLSPSPEYFERRKKEWSNIVKHTDESLMHYMNKVRLTDISNDYVGL